MDHPQPTTAAKDSIDKTGSNICDYLKLTTIHLIGGIYCYKCEVTFGDKKSFDKHYKQHDTDEIIYTCVACKNKCSDYRQFREHCYKHVTKDKYKCEQCSKFFAKHTYLKQHQTLHVLKKYKCISSCSFECATREELILHKKTNNHKPPYPCQNCDVKMYDINVCKTHMKEHAVQEYICPVCSKHISDKSHVLEHYKDTGIEYEQLPASAVKILCIYCDTAFKIKDAFETHALNNHNRILYACYSCKEPYEEYDKFLQHCFAHEAQFTKEQQIQNGDLHSCHICNIQLSDLAACKDHINSHKVIIYACVVCNQRCKAEYVMRHIRKHFPLDFHICEICEKVFNSQKNLRKHSATHGNLVPIDYLTYTCTLCNKRFMQRNNCLTHLKITHNINDSIMKSREQEFIKTNVNEEPIDPVSLFENIEDMTIEQGNINNNNNESATAKKHKCNECGRTFNRPCKLKEHMNTHLGAQQYNCTVCSTSFYLYRTWYKHLNKVHNIKPKKMKNYKKNAKNAEAVSNELKEDTVKATCDTDSEKQANNLEILNDELIFQMCDSSGVSQSVSNDSSMMKDGDLLKPNLKNESNASNENENINRNTNNKHNQTFVEIMDDNSESFSAGKHSSLTSMPLSNICEYPHEHGPDVTNVPSIDMDEDMPHIDPLLTIKFNDAQESAIDNVQSVNTGMYDNLNWQPMTVKKECHDDYNLQYQDLAQLSADIISIINYNSY